MKYRVYFIKHVTKFEMTYGIFDNLDEANKALSYGSSINTIDKWKVETINV